MQGGSASLSASLELWLPPDKRFATVIILTVMLAASDELISFQVSAVTHPVQSWELDLQRFSRLQNQGA